MFTGADKDRNGLLELANGGTAFIDEIGDVSLNLQAKLLRVLETGELRPVGSNDCRMASFRLVAADHRSLEQRVSSGEFRGDLFFRLNVFRIAVPPLRYVLQTFLCLHSILAQSVPRGERILQIRRSLYELAKWLMALERPGTATLLSQPALFVEAIRFCLSISRILRRC